MGGSLLILGIDIAFHDAERNNLYRFLYQHTLADNERREFLKRILKNVGNLSNLLNEVKNDVVITVNESKPKPQNQIYPAKRRIHRRKVENSSDEDGDSDDEDEDDEEESEEMEEENNSPIINSTITGPYIHPNPSATNPLSCNESVFTCYKRTLMNQT